jgi:hypothetical protein
VREAIPHKEAIHFCKWHLGKYCFAPFTGGDWPAWIAFCYLLRAYSAGCGYGREDRLDALRATVHLAQAKVRPVFVQAIPAMLDWSHVAEIWPLLVDGDDQNITAVKRPFTEPRKRRGA